MTTQTNMMRADEIAFGFNTVEDKKYWRASIAGTRLKPEVHFNSRSTMVQVAYRVVSGDFTVTFSKSAAAFGDYLASAHRSMQQILASLKAAGLPFASDIEGAALVIEYNPHSKDTVAALVRHGDVWGTVEPMTFKVPERKTDDSVISPLDDPNTDA